MSTAQEPATHMHIPRLSIDGWASWGMLCGIILAFDAIPQGKLAFEIAVCWLLAAVLLPHVVDHLDTLKAAALAPIHEHQLTLPQLDARSARGLSRWSTRWAQQRSRIQHALHSDDSPFANGLSAVLAVGLTLALATYLGRLPTLFASSAIAICAILAITSKYRQPNVNGGLQKGIVIALAWALCASLDSPMTLVDLAQTALAGLLLTGHLCL